MNILSRMTKTSKLSLSLLVRILLFSGVFTVAITSVQLHFDYKAELEHLEHQLLTIEKTQVESIGIATWDFNEPLIRQQLQGLLGFDGVRFVKLNTNYGKEYTSGKNNLKSTISRRFELKHQGALVGTIEVYADKQFAKERIVNKLYLVLLSQAVKTFIVSIFILFVMHSLVVRHIEQIFHWLKSFKPESTFSPLPTAECLSDANEMMKLKSAINSMGQQVHEYTVSLEDKVRKRTEELEQANRKLEQLAYTDSLTKVANRLSFFKQADRELNRARRLSYELGVMMIDLDHFKKINDTFGHEAGDQVLQNVSHAMKGCLRQEDTLGRLGGEEFAILVPGADRLGMYNLACRLQQAIELLDFAFLEKGKMVTMSIGYTKIDKSEPFKSALNRADKHLYVAKANGRNQFVTDKEFIPNIAG